jgi:hypothetical protein
MAVRIPIITVFDSKGLRAAQYQLNKVSGNISNLGRNFTIAGAAFAGITAGLGKSVKVASDLGESVNAVNVSFGKSAKGILDFGKTASTTLGVSQVDFNNAAVRFSAFADRIVGRGADATGFIRDITTRASDFASVFNIDVAEALRVFQSGLAGEAEPLKRFGINLLETEVKAYAVRAEIIKQGETLTEQQKVLARYGLLMESTNKTAGDFANTSGNLANGTRILGAQMTDLQGEIGQALLPALQRILPTLRALVTEFGTELKSAVDSVDWNATLTSLVNLLTFFVRNIEVITKLVAVLWTLNTAYNAIKVTAGLLNAALAIVNIGLGKTTVAAGIATTAMKVLRTAMLLTGIGAALVALGLVIDGITGASEAAEEGTEPVKKFGYAVKASGDNADYAGGKFGIATKKVKDFNAEVSKIKPDLSGYMDAGERRQRLDNQFAQGGMANYMASLPGAASSGAGSASSTARAVTSALAPVNKVLNLGVSQAKQAGRLQAAGFSQAYIDNLFSAGGKTVAAAKAAVKKASTNTKFVTNQNKKAASTLQAITAANEAAAQASAAAEAAAEQARAEAARKEAEALAERERVLASFANSVISTFAAIKEGIENSFSLPELGGSTDSIIRNMDKLLTRVKAFSQNITKLSTMGLNPELLQQVISAGPVGGASLAASLVAGGAGALSRINAGFGEIGALSSEIAMTGTQSRFDTPAQQNVYNINVEGGVGSGATIGKAIVDAIKAYERTSGAVWQGA